MTREQELEGLLREMTEAAYSLACESNGIYDNEWTLPDGMEVKCEFPIASWCRARDRIEDVRERAKSFLDPEEAEQSEKWRNACATAQAIVEIHQREGREGSLSRNIADAINGSLKLTMGDAKAGVKLFTMQDRLKQLVAEGRLVEMTPAVPNG